MKILLALPPRSNLENKKALNPKQVSAFASLREGRVAFSTLMRTEQSRCHPSAEQIIGIARPRSYDVGIVAAFLLTPA
jgi:hypothetical protein